MVFPQDSFSNPQAIARQILECCRPGRILDVGCGSGSLVRSLLTEGIDAYGVDLVPHMAGDRILTADVRHLPLPTDSFDTVLCLDALEYLSGPDVQMAAQELFRVARADLYVRILTSPNGNPAPRAVRSGEWWESTLLRAGFHRHPLSGRIEDFDQEWGTDRIVLLMEKSGPSFPELTVPGREARAGLMRWQLAGSFVSPGDRVLAESGCGRYVVKCSCPGAIVGGPALQNPNVIVMLDAGLDPHTAIQRARGLPAGGRVLLGAEHMESLRTLSQTLDQDLRLELICAASGFQYGGPSGPPAQEVYWEHPTLPEAFSGFALIVASKTPLVESPMPIPPPFPNLMRKSGPGDWAREFWDLSRFYRFPAVIPALTLIYRRLRSGSVLSQECERTLDLVPADSADYGAALCVLMYRSLSKDSPLDVQTWERVRQYLDLQRGSRHVLRWQISISYAAAIVRLNEGAFGEAARFFEYCVARDSLFCCVHLATKTSEAYFWLGWLAYARQDAVGAEKWWSAALCFGRRLMAQDWDDVLIDPEYPNLFDYGDGLRELIYSFESIAKCANGIHVLREDGCAGEARWAQVSNSFRFQAERLREQCLRNEQQVRRFAAEIQSERDRTAERIKENEALKSDLTTIRRDLVDRTARLEAALDAIERLRGEQSADLDRVSKELNGCAARMKAASEENSALRVSLEAMHAELLSCTSRLKAESDENSALQTDLEVIRNELLDRTSRLEAALQEVEQNRLRWSVGRLGWKRNPQHK